MFEPTSHIARTIAAKLGKMAHSLAARLSALSLVEGDVVVVVGLAGTPQYNHCAARVLAEPPSDQGRIGVQLMHGSRKRLAVRRQNLLRASVEDDRVALLTRVAMERQRELVVARRFLLSKLQDEEGLLLHIASFFPHRETVCLTTGFAMGRIVPSWTHATLTSEGLGWQPLHGRNGPWDGTGVPVEGEPVKDGIVRIDCAVVSLGLGRYLIAGGCSDHPSRARSFFKSAFIYDALTHVVRALPDMPCPRHGCGGALLDGKVYIIGGDYTVADGDPSKALVTVYDLSTGVWENLDMPIPEALRSLHLAFVPVNAIGGRLVMLVQGVPLVYNPLCHAAGFIACEWADAPDSAATMHPNLGLGTMAMASVAWGEHLIVASGRGGSEACQVASLRFTHARSAEILVPRAITSGTLDTTAPSWALCRWGSLGTASDTGRIGGGLVVIHDRLYISGGVDEGTSGRFDGSVARWDGQYSDLPWPGELETPSDRGVFETKTTRWQKLDGLELPTAMHAHHAIAIPWLPRAA